MSQAERHAKQQDAIAEQAAAALRHRQALAPKRIAVLVAGAFGFHPWRELSHSRIAYDGYLRAQRMPHGVSGVVRK